MSSSTSSGDVLGERAAGEAELVVELDGGGECEEAAGDAGSEAVEGSGAVAFEGEDVLGGPVDRFDPLTDWREMRAGWLLVGAAGLRGDLGGGSECRGARRRFCRGRGRGGSLVPALRSDDGRVERGELGLELLAAEVLIADQGQELAGLAAAARATSCRQTSFSSTFAEVNAIARGVPSIANSVCSLNP
jgi:hypothetical protein